ncbi:phosphoglycolate phosphatase [Planobispora rosea]|uniref:Phosphoglycolate phosphatase n=1 Tax=Planobispora rosea TaxID=35762 RepID=A0A8J3WDL4_PLARO|nr:HAD family hydrolase [Planobispora rosea]GGS71412.1 phosphoglycolate phosphatase [Planobispora rosea]GIH85475.1 phosphoglycolate phosphatase [Planobispora rosea]
MRYHALVCGYDGTLSTDGRVGDSTVAALERLVRSGRRLIMVTGRDMDGLTSVFDRLDLFERIVAENGAVLYDPARQEATVLAEPPPAEFADRLRRAGARPLSVGEVAVATREPHGGTVLDTIRDLGLELQVIFNKGAVTVLPSGVNKATGLAAALDALGLSPHNTVGVGDAENDHALLSACECPVAVADAVPAIKERCDVVTDRPGGDGVTELIDRILDDDLADVDPGRRHLPLGTAEGGERVRLAPYGTRLMIAGPSNSGKSTTAAALLERVSKAGYQFCLIDPEGDYTDGIGGAIVLGDARRAPTEEEILQVLEKPAQSVVVSLLGVPLDDRPGFFEAFLPRLSAVRARQGHPHWLIVDEAHHMLPQGFGTESVELLGKVGGLLLVTVHPSLVSEPVLQALNAVVAVGEDPADVLTTFASAVGRDGVRSDLPGDLATGEFLLWRPAGEPVRARLIPPEGERQRHLRKYAAGELGEEDSFYFRGPDEALNLRAGNLTAFCHIADGVDDGTWEHHLRQGDYSRWLAENVKDEELAAEVAEIEQEAGKSGGAGREGGGSAAETRRRVRELIENRYTAPAEPGGGAGHLRGNATGRRSP